MTVITTAGTPGVDRFTRAQLLRTVQLFASDPELPHLLDLGATERQWHQLAESPYLQIWLLSWPAGATTDWHDHGATSGAFTTVRGQLTEHSWLGGVQERLIPAGEGRAFGAQHIHSVTNTGAEPALSVHAYSPRLTQMTRYEIVQDRLETTGVERAGVDW